MLDEYFWELEQRHELNARLLVSHVEWLVNNRARRVTEEACLPSRDKPEFDKEYFQSTMR